MKKRFKASAFLLTSMLAMTMLTGCQSTSDSAMSRVTHVYKATELELDDEVILSEIKTAKDAVHIFTFIIDFSTERGTRSYQLFNYDIKKDKLTRTDLPELGDKIRVSSYTAAPDGTLYIIGDNLAASTATYPVYSYRGDQLTKHADNLASLTKSSRSFNLSGLTVDGDGNIHAASDNAVVVFDKDFGKLFEIESDAHITDISTAVDGRVYVSLFGSNNSIAYVDVETKSFIKAVDMPESNELSNANAYAGVGYDLYLNTIDALYGYNAEDGEPTELLNWLNSDIVWDEIYELAVIDENRALCHLQSWDDETYTNEVLLLTRVPDNKVPAKYIVRLAVNENLLSLTKDIVRFNRSSDKYRIVIEQYNNYITSEDIRAGDKQLRDDILAGTAPDIITTSSFAYTSDLSEHGAFVDLYELMDGDKEFDRTAFFEDILRIFERSGRLYEMPTHVALNSICAKTANVPTDRWTVSEFIDYVESLPEDKFLIYENTNPDELLDVILILSLDEFIDYDTAECRLDSDEFKRVLELVKNCTERINCRDWLAENELEEYLNDSRMAYRNDVVMLDYCYIDSVERYLSRSMTFNDDCTLIGYPTSNGNGCAVVKSCSYAINKDSAVVDGAWEFIKYMADSEVSRTSYRSCFPVQKASFERLAAKNLGTHYFYAYSGYGSSSWTTPEGEEFKVPDYINLDEGVMFTLTQEVIDEIKSLLCGGEHSADPDGRVMSIIREELAYYLSGDKSLDETAKLIQNRVSTYISEIS